MARGVLLTLGPTLEGALVPIRGRGALARRNQIMRQQITKDLFAYWSRLRGARAAPDRSDIDPGAIRQILADTFILEVDAERNFPLRLSGTRINALWLVDQKGVSIIDWWRDDDRSGIAAALRTVVDGVTPVVAGARARVAGGGMLELELLLLPLRHFGKTHSRVLGALAPICQPDWLGLHSVGALDLVSLRIVEAEKMRPTQFKHAHTTVRRPTSERPRLIVYDGGKS